ncbi:MAG: HAMP domain-containing histidine kinase [Myxococcales bacterium]|nr:HAMP domain-containing histidine kinase [Myxococcales bacterium]
MRSNKRTARTPIIFVTGSARAQEQVFEGYESGAVDYLIKPVDNHVLRSKVAVYEQLHRQNEQLHRQRAALERSVHELSSASEALRASEAAQRTLNEVLEERVHERTRDLEAANRDLEAFAHSVAHNLRTPLRSIASFVDIVTAEADLSADHADLLERVTHAAANMSELLNGLLRLSEIRQVEAHPRDVDLAAQAADVIAARGWQAVEWSVEAPQPTSADPELSRVVLEVLFENAIKFTAWETRPTCADHGGAGRRAGAHGARQRRGLDPRAHAGLLNSRPFSACTRRCATSTARRPGSATAPPGCFRSVTRHASAESRPGEGAAFHFTRSRRAVLAAPLRASTHCVLALPHACTPSARRDPAVRVDAAGSTAVQKKPDWHGARKACTAPRGFDGRRRRCTARTHMLLRTPHCG